MATRALDITLSAYNSADAIFTFVAEGIDPATSESEPIDISALTIVFVVEDMAGGEMWEGAVGSGITLTGADGEFTVWIPLATMQDLEPGEYRIGCTLSSGSITTQLMRGSLTVIDGIIG